MRLGLFRRIVIANAITVRFAVSRASPAGVDLSVVYNLECNNA